MKMALPAHKLTPIAVRDECVSACVCVGVRESIFVYCCCLTANIKAV